MFHRQNLLEAGEKSMVVEYRLGIAQAFGDLSSLSFSLQEKRPLPVQQAIPLGPRNTMSIKCQFTHPQMYQYLIHTIIVTSVLA